MNPFIEFVNEAHERLRVLTDESATIRFSPCPMIAFENGECRESNSWQVSISATVYPEGGIRKFVYASGDNESLRKATDLCESEFRTKVAALYAEPAQLAAVA